MRDRPIPPARRSSQRSGGGNQSPTPNHLLVGRAGEALAREYLSSQYYRIIGQNVRIGARDEIDIVAFDPIENLLTFVEVKSRARYDEECTPESSMTWYKRRRVRRAAQRWISDHDYDGAYRLDLVCIANNAVTAHYRDIEAD
jgi:Holliday junction resolvase-like predicted endonuclease